MGLFNKRSIVLARLKSSSLWAMLLLLPVSGCNGMKACVAMEFMQGTVADGVARLSVQHISMITSELKPRFSGPKAQMIITKYKGHEEYGRGEVLWVLKDELIEHPEERIVYKDCLGDIFTWQGKAEIVSATMHMKGRLTNNPDQPIIPDEDGITFKVHARAHNLAIRLRGREGYLRIDEGDLKFTAMPRLAKSHAGEAKGLLAAPTSYMRFSDIHLSNIRGTLISDQLILAVTIENSDLYVQVGEGKNGEENVLSGKITMFNNQREVPTDGKGLDPDYDREKFIKTFDCSQELSGQPLSYEYETIEDKIAGPMAGLSSLVMGAVAKSLEVNTICGMASPGVLLNTQIKPTNGGLGEVSNEVVDCELEFKNFTTEADCHGVAYELNGKARVKRAKKTLFGLITGDINTFKTAVDLYKASLLDETPLDTPVAVIPSYKQSVVFEISAELFEIDLHECVRSENKKDKRCLRRKENKNFDDFKIYSGLITSKLKPVLAKQLDATDKRFGFCAMQVPISEAELSLSNIKASLKAAGQEFYLPLDGDIDLVNGRIGARENELRGELKVGGKAVLFTKDGKHSQLNPEYNPKSFFDSFTRCQSIELPESDADCNAEKGLAAHVARALIPVAGVLIKELAPQDSVEKLKAFKGAQVVSADDNKPLPLGARAKNFMGLGTQIVKVIINRTKNNSPVNINDQILAVNGQITGTLNIVQKGWDLPVDEWAKFEARVGPLESNDTTVTVTNAEVKDLDIAIKDTPKANAQPLITIKSAGQINIKATPFMGEHKEKEIFSITTPIIRIDDFAINNAVVWFTAEGRKIPLTIKSASLKGFNGKIDGVGNYVSGTITFELNGKDVTVAIPEQDLIPPFKDGGFKQQKFDNSYINTPNLKEPLPGELKVPVPAR